MFRRCCGASFVALFLLCSSASCFAKSVVLFDKDGPVKDYSELVKTLEPGDRLVFSTGKSFVIGKLLSGGKNAGSNNLIFELGKSAAIRIPKRDIRIETSNGYWEGYRALIDFGVPVPKVFIAKRGEFTLVERYEKLFSLRDWVNSDYNLAGFKNQKLAEELADFIVKTRRFGLVGDTRAIQNIVYTPKGWIVADWSSSHIFASRQEDVFIAQRLGLNIVKQFGINLRVRMLAARLADGPGVYTQQAADQLKVKYRNLSVEELYIDQVENFVASSPKKTAWLGSFGKSLRQLYAQHCGKLNMFVNTRGR